MRHLIKVMLVVAMVFALTFISLKAAGVLSVEQIEAWLTYAQGLSPIYAGVLTVALLLADIVIAMPTLTVTILSGFFLGSSLGALSAIIGMSLAGVTGYLLGKRYGDSILMLLLKDEHKINDAKSAFQSHGLGMILLSRAIPILPEVTACLAGATNMTFSRFMFAWLLSTVPYCLIAAYAGSLSSLSDPKPALIGAAVLTTSLWIGWFVFRKFKLKSSAVN
ncbi:VTT domain-containing protein [Vibrio sp. ZSDE26]|uniref:TVP38/TMEM64 family membrane protein n=1 Tax=Vibrio amylolyticus TaxID=2847292 RepID=A0A9X2BHG6_9VIBR|nr:VTT domain-containing protein [Vibrio amylolyticus]MCK6263854.1 VTT domain-containing protein [Vibrio amylolyticus]